MKRSRIFLVEDEPLVRMIVAEQLEDAGYEIATADNGLSAIREFQRSAQSFDALVTDVRMGSGPDGWQVAKVARGLKSSLPVIYMTGDSASAAVSHAVPEGMVLRKPYHRNELLAALDLLLLDEGELGEGDRLHVGADGDDGSLWSWIYISQSLLSAGQNNAIIAQIVESSRRNNRILDISGALMLADRTFAQVIEGPRGNIDTLRKRILADDRHRDIKTLWHGSVSERRFAGWTLAYAQSSHFYNSVMSEIRRRANDPASSPTIVRLMSRLAEGEMSSQTNFVR